MRGPGETLALWLTGLVTAAVFAVLYAPLLISALFSVVEVQRGRVLWDTLSLGAYARVWSDPTVVAALVNTVVVALAAVAATAVLAVALALYTTSDGAIGRRAIELVIYLPFLMPPIVTGLSLLVASAEAGLDRGLLTIILGHIAFVLAVAYRLVLTRLQSLPASLTDASADLGASPMQTFRLVLLPQLSSAIVSGAVLALTLSFDETLISTFLAGDRMTLPLRLWAMMRVGFTPEINALVTLVLIVSIGLAAAVAWRMRPQGLAEEE
jgi:ABC-type spermidine/putrescine transport system permease subunit II